MTEQKEQEPDIRFLKEDLDVDIKDNPQRHCITVEASWPILSSYIEKSLKRDKLLEEGKARTICLVGSVKQESEWRACTDRLTELGYIVLEAGCYHPNNEQKRWERVERVHLNKILSSSLVGVIRKLDGSVGGDTQKEIEFARRHNIEVVNATEFILNALKEVRE